MQPLRPEGGHDMYKEARVIDPHESEAARERYDELMGGMSDAQSKTNAIETRTQ